MTFVEKRITALGQMIVHHVSVVGQLAILGLQIGFWLIKGHKDRKILAAQLHEIGVRSLPMVTVAAIFTGMVLVLQVGKQFVSLKAESFIGGVVGLSLARELAPVLTGVVIAGRVGSAIAAELGTMKVTEQIDALQVLATNPVSYLVVPRVIACATMVPVLTIFANLVGLAGGALVAVTKIEISLEVFFQSVLDSVAVEDFVSGVLKAVVFGVIIAVLACYKGLTTRGGAEGVGRATTGSVVVITISLLVTNYLLSELFFTYTQTFAS